MGSPGTWGPRRRGKKRAAVSYAALVSLVRAAKPLLLSCLHDARALGTAGGAVSGGAGPASFRANRAAGTGRPRVARNGRVTPGSRGRRRVPRSSSRGGSRAPSEPRRSAPGGDTCQRWRTNRPYRIEHKTPERLQQLEELDRKSTRLNSSHLG